LSGDRWPIAGKADGFIGTDIFASWLITLDYRNAKLILAPLPPQAGDLPGDRAVPPEFADYRRSTIGAISSGPADLRQQIAQALHSGHGHALQRHDFNRSLTLFRR